MLFSKTQSICPDCFKRIDAVHVLENDTLYMEKTCDIHGLFRSKIWQGEQRYTQWVKPKIPIVKRFSMTAEQQGCPFDCGLCPEHRQHTCTAVLEVTSNCNLNCTFCFADSGHSKLAEDPSFEQICCLLASVYETSGGCNLQISGGEPTLRKDLPGIIAKAKETGFDFIQLNTNGLLLAADSGLAKELKTAGLSSVFLQFDGTSDDVYEKLRQKKLFSVKQTAISACMDNDIGIILVPTLVPGINVEQIGSILQFALEHAPGVRGVHFQPISYFGRHKGMPTDKDRITIPEILTEIETQTQKKFRQNNFKPSSCEHALCSFNGKFLIQDDGTIQPLLSFNSGCCQPIKAEQGSRQAKDSVKRLWGAPDKQQAVFPQALEDGLDRFIRQSRTHIFSVSGMAFQDAWNLDLERLKGCCIHSVAPDGRLIPFCAYNLTSNEGKGLYRHP